MEDVIKYRRWIFVGYTGVGFVVATIILWASISDPLDDVSLGMMLVFLTALLVFEYVGAAVALDLGSDRESWSPLRHLRSILRRAPVGLGGLAIVLLMDVGLYQAKLSSLLAVPPMAYGYLLSQWIKRPD